MAQKPAEPESPSLLASLFGFIVYILEALANLLKSFAGPPTSAPAANERTVAAPDNVNQYAKAKDPNYQTLAFISDQELFGKNKKKIT